MTTPPDRESIHGNIFIMTVTARDDPVDTDLNTPRSSSVKVIINVTDINDNHPKFNKLEFSAKIPEV